MNHISDGSLINEDAKLGDFDARRIIVIHQRRGTRVKKSIRFLFAFLPPRPMIDSHTKLFFLALGPPNEPFHSLSIDTVLFSELQHSFVFTGNWPLKNSHCLRALPSANALERTGRKIHLPTSDCISLPFFAHVLLYAVQTIEPTTRPSNHPSDPNQQTIFLFLLRHFNYPYRSVLLVLGLCVLISRCAPISEMANPTHFIIFAPWRQLQLKH